MGLFGRTKPKPRVELAAAAAKAVRKRKLPKALRLYEELLEREPDNADLRRKIAGLQARTKAPEDAWISFRFAAEALVIEGFTEKALGVYREAAHHLPRQPEVWIAIADIHLQNGRGGDALAALREGRGRLRKRRDRSDAIRLLARARDIEPDCFDVGFDLSRLYWRSGDRKSSMRVLEELVQVSTVAQLRRVRRAQFLHRPGLRTAWSWLRAAFGKR